jgi:hypothetical protein
MQSELLKLGWYVSDGKKFGEGHLVYNLKSLQIGNERYLVLGRVSLWLWVVDTFKDKYNSCVLLNNASLDEVCQTVDLLERKGV